MLDRISINPNICHGKPCIKGTRIMVSVVLALLEEGLTFAKVREEYPELTDEDVKASVEYARVVIENEDIRLLEKVGS